MGFCYIRWLMGNKHGHLVSNFHRNTIQKKGRNLFSALFCPKINCWNLEIIVASVLFIYFNERCSRPLSCGEDHRCVRCALLAKRKMFFYWQKPLHHSSVVGFFGWLVLIYLCRDVRDSKVWIGSTEKYFICTPYWYFCFNAEKSLPKPQYYRKAGILGS